MSWVVGVLCNGQSPDVSATGVWWAAIPEDAGVSIARAEVADPGYREALKSMPANRAAKHSTRAEIGGFFAVFPTKLTDPHSHRGGQGFESPQLHSEVFTFQ
jgi:hypothetical protein